MVCRPGLRSCAHRYRPLKDLLVPARTVRTDTSEERREVLRCRFGGFGWCQRLEQWVGLYDVNLDPIQPRSILVRESDTLPGGLHERLGGAQVTR